MDYYTRTNAETWQAALDEWHARLLNQAHGNEDNGLPNLPPPAIQEQFVGSSFVPAFNEALQFYKVVVNSSIELENPVWNENAKFLDFGCGWGRYLRYAMRDFPKDRLSAVDVDPDIIELCKSSGIPAQYSQLDPKGKLPFPDNTFSHVIAYSVFTHLPEPIHLNWANEIIRVLRPGGVFVGTIETRKFLEHIRGMGQGNANENDWHKALAEYRPQLDGFLDDYEQGKFVYLPTGGGGVRTSDIYGEAVISPSYIEHHWKGVDIHAVIDEDFWQTVVVLRKHDTPAEQVPKAPEPAEETPEANEADGLLSRIRRWLR